MIPSQTALRYVWHQLMAMQHRALKDAIVLLRANDKKSAISLQLQADDMWQVGQFLEEQIIPDKPKRRKRGK